MEFTFLEYSKLLKEFNNNNYTCVSYFNKTNSNKELLLRHDIDIDIFNCLNLASIEEINGFYSTWFVQIDNDFYNPLSSQALKILKRLSEKHILGLHINPAGMNYQPESIEDLTIWIERIYKFYSDYLPIERIISFHRPAKYLSDSGIKINGFINAYDDSFIKEMNYISDSNRRPFLDLKYLEEAFRTGQSINLLTHPIWWSYERKTIEEKYEELTSTAVNKICKSSLINNISCFSYLKEIK